VIPVAETDSKADNLKTLDKFSKQLHMYSSDQLRYALKVSIGMVKDIISSGTSQEAIMTRLEEDACMIVLPKGSGFHVQPGDEVRIEVAGGHEGCVYRATVAGLAAQSDDEVCYLKEFTLHRQERRGAQRFPVRLQTRFFNPQDGAPQLTPYEGVVLNISRTGLCLVSNNPLPAGSGIVFPLGMGLENLEVPPGTPGTITRVREEQEASGYLYSYGVVFDQPVRAA
jgi:hypothetical protein